MIQLTSVLLARFPSFASTIAMQAISEGWDNKNNFRTFSLSSMSVFALLGLVRTTTLVSKARYFGTFWSVKIVGSPARDCAAISSALVSSPTGYSD